MTSIRILGPVEASRDERPVPLGGRRQLKLFAFLLLNANRAVSADVLTDAVWGASRPAAANRLQMAVTRLRRALGPLDEGREPRLRTVSGGYMIVLRRGELDAELFAEFVRDGRSALQESDPAKALELLSAGLNLWRGPPLAEVAFEDFAQPEIRRLEELRLSALESRIDAELRLGQHAHVVGELEGLLAEHPTRERLAAQLMLALYRTGRQADALEVYQGTRTHLTNELGLDPSPALTALQVEILNQAPSLELRTLSGLGNASMQADTAATRPTRDSLSCPRCRQANLPGSTYCQACGALLTAVCPGCGREVGLEARFCSSCGRPLPRADPPRAYTPPHLSEKIIASRAALEGERKQVTVLLCDVARSKKGAEPVGEEEYRELVDGFLATALEAVHRYEGTVSQFLGAGFLALFGAPIAHEDHARRAVLAAYDLVRDVEGVQVRIGISTGSVVVGRIADDLRMGYTAFGSLIGLAQRLQSDAEPGEILVSDTTASRVTGYFGLDQLDPVAVEDQTIRPHRVTGIGPRRARVEGADAELSPFVGRDRELAALLWLLEQARGGDGQITGITGDPGLGKSRLLVEFSRQVQDADVYQGRCLSYGAATPYLPIADLLRATCRIERADDAASVEGKLRAAVDKSGLGVEATLSFFRHLLGEGDPALSELDPATVKGRTFAALKEFLLTRARRRPVVLIVEDLHWIDRTSEEFLSEFVDDITAARILLVTTARPGYNAPWAGRSSVTQMALSRLDEGDSARIVYSALGDGSDQDIASQIVDRGEGNPFFLEELARASADAPIGAVPGTVQDVLAARIDRLSVESKWAIQVASVIGREVSSAVFDAVWDGADKEALIRELKRLEFLRELRTGGETIYIFKHALTQEVAYDSILSATRRTLHGRIGTAIERLVADRIDEHCELLAHHFLRSAELEKALHYLVLANRKAAARNAMEEAIAYFYEALGVLDRMPDTCENRARRAGIVFEQAGVFGFANRIREYYELILAQEPIVRELGDDRLLGAFLARLGHTDSQYARLEDGRKHLTEAIELCERCENVADAAAAYAMLAWIHWVLGEYEDALRARDLALEWLEREFHPFGYNIARGAAIFTHAWAGRLADAEREAEEAAAVGLERSDLAIVSFSRALLASAYLHYRDWNRALEEAQASLAVAPTPWFRGFPQAYLAAALCQTGNAEQGIGILDIIEPLARSTDEWISWMSVALLRAECLLSVGDYDRAEPTLRELVAEGERVRSPWTITQSNRMIAECILATGGDDAAEHLERAIEVARAKRMHNDLALALAVEGRRLRAAGDETADGK